MRSLVGSLVGARHASPDGDSRVALPPVIRRLNADSSESQRVENTPWRGTLMGWCGGEMSLPSTEWCSVALFVPTSEAEPRSACDTGDDFHDSL